MPMHFGQLDVTTCSSPSSKGSQMPQTSIGGGLEPRSACPSVGAAFLACLWGAAMSQSLMEMALSQHRVAENAITGLRPTPASALLPRMPHMGSLKREAEEGCMPASRARESPLHPCPAVFPPPSAQGTGTTGPEPLWADISGLWLLQDFLTRW